MQNVQNNFTVENLVAKYRDYVNEHCPKEYVVGEGKDGKILIEFKEGPSFYFGIKAHDNDSDEIFLIREDQYKKDPSRPFLTSIYSAEQNIAELGVKMLLERIEHPELPPRNVVLPVKIFDQGTTAAARQL